MNALKLRGHAQSLHEVSTTRKEPLGILHIGEFGEKYRYAYFASAVNRGLVTVPAVADAKLVGVTATATAKGARVISMTITALGSAMAQGAFAGGKLVVSNRGDAYDIESSNAVGATDTVVKIQLATPLRTALTASETLTAMTSPHYGLSASTTDEYMPAGVTLMDQPAGSYGWVQTGGLATVLFGGAAAVGTMVKADSVVAGAVIATTESYTAVVDVVTMDIDVPDTWGIVTGTAGVDTKYSTVQLMLD